MLEILKAILFGIVEGITEWLPVSSTGHMILLNEFLHLNVSAAFWEMFLVVIQLGAIAAVENQGRQKDIKVFGWDLTAKAISGMDGGYVTAVLQQDPEKMGAEALNALNSITSGKTVPKTILVPATVVTKANVDSYRPLFK